MKEVEFYKCPICGNVIEVINGDINHITCCGKPMEKLVANSVDAATEKHVPVYEVDGDKINVTVGSTVHPMLDEHYIMWIALVTDNKVCRVNFNPGEEPKARFPYVPGATVYAYCNLHSLWKEDVK